MFSAAEWPHQGTRARDPIGVVDGEPGFVFVDVSVRHVEHVEAEDNYNPPDKHGSRYVTVESNNTFKLQQPLWLKMLLRFSPCCLKRTPARLTVCPTETCCRTLPYRSRPTSGKILESGFPDCKTWTDSRPERFLRWDIHGCAIRIIVKPNASESAYLHPLLPFWLHCDLLQSTKPSYSILGKAPGQDVRIKVTL